MKALVLEEQGTLVYKDVDTPQPVGPEDLLLRIAAVGVCGSDIPRAFRGKAYVYPLILGHEFSAVVEEAPGGSSFTPGDRVAVFPLLPDPGDPMVQIGEYGVSSGYDYFGSRRHGALAELLYVPESNLFRLPDRVPLLHAAAVEPSAVALHAALKLHIRAHTSALVIGGGPIGVLVGQWLSILGCSRVYIAEPDPKKIDLIERHLPQLEVIDPKAGDTVEQLRERTAGAGADCVIDACGIPLTFLQAIESAAVFGQVVILGDTSQDITMGHELVTSILRKELILYGTWNSKPTPKGKSEWDMVIQHMDVDLHIGPFISHTPSLEMGPQLLGDMAAGKIWYNKVIFSVNPEKG
jgi:L-iditol 2-dehydrogenase/galactitol-1-phosphate 5-dehydrogenase